MKKVSRKLRKCNAWPPTPGSQEALQQQAAVDRLHASQRAAKVSLARAVHAPATLSASHVARESVHAHFQTISVMLTGVGLSAEQLLLHQEQFSCLPQDVHQQS